MVRLNQMKESIEIISADGKQRLGKSYTDSDFSKWVEWAQQFLKENGPDPWKLPKYDLCLFILRITGKQCMMSPMS